MHSSIVGALAWARMFYSICEHEVILSALWKLAVLARRGGRTNLAVSSIIVWTGETAASRRSSPPLKPREFTTGFFYSLHRLLRDRPEHMTDLSHHCNLVRNPSLAIRSLGLHRHPYYAIILADGVNKSELNRWIRPILVEMIYHVDDDTLFRPMPGGGVIGGAPGPGPGGGPPGGGGGHPGDGGGGHLGDGGGGHPGDGGGGPSGGPGGGPPGGGGSTERSSGSGPSRGAKPNALQVGDVDGNAFGILVFVRQRGAARACVSWCSD